MLTNISTKQTEFKLLELLNKVNQMLLRFELEEFDFIYNKIFAEIGDKLELSDISLFKFQEYGNLNHSSLHAFWNNKNSNNVVINYQNSFFEYNKQFETHLNTHTAFNVQKTEFMWNSINKDFFSQTVFYLCVPIKQETGFKGFFILGSNKKIVLESLAVHFLKIFANNFGQFIYDRKKKQLSNPINVSKYPLNSFYESVLNAVPAYISVVDAAFNYIYLSESAIKDSALRTWLIGKNDFDYCNYTKKPLIFAESRKALFDKVLDKQEACSLEEEFVLDNGQLKIELRSMTPVFENGNLQYVIVYGVDITELKNKEDIITKQYHALESSPLGIALLNKEGKYFYMNSHHANVFGYTSEELMGKTWDVLYAEIEAKSISEIYFPDLMANGTWAGEIRFKKKTGEIIFQDIVLTTFEDGGIVCMTKDITAVKQELDTAKLMYNQFELALSSANLGMTKYYLNTSKIEFHETFLKLIGYHASEIPELTMNNWFSFIHFDDRERVIIGLKDYISNYKLNSEYENFRTEYRLIHKKGHFIWSLGVGKIINHDFYGPIMTGFNVDISLIKEAENELRMSLEKETQLNELKSRFVSMASHEFRTPLSTIRLGVEISKKILDMDNLEAQAILRIHNKLDDILIDVDRITELMTDFLQLGKIEAKKVSVNMERVDLNIFLVDFLSKNRNQEWSNRDIKLVLNQEECCSCLDLKLMIQILTNLISNALKYSESHTGLIIRTKIEKKQVIIEIEDDGFGISEGDLPFIFESFYRAKAVENISGTGLGLSIVKLFVEMNNGKINITSSLNVGTKVTLTFPLAY